MSALSGVAATRHAVMAPGTANRGARATPKLVKAGLTMRVTLLRSGETLQQSVSAKPRGQEIAAAI
ncbi:hypothetical protein [Bradyrhizobium sp.]|uniref:hypothetical protein n=1 Tax=Bradyrhizobium sp. TaxID=376 RepID=UPI002725B1DC|nr:hypothetical protein [Bradyrhizobium sp.]MDO9296269.1 hypothetical protein [Bradyrhizobium sp.]